MTEGQLTYDPDEAERKLHLHLELKNLHAELASYYRAGSKDRKLISRLWFHIDGLELELRMLGEEP